MSGRTAPRAHHVEGVGWLVTRTDDPKRARLLVIEQLMRRDAEYVDPEHLSGYLSPEQRTWHGHLDILRPVPLSVIEPGWYRMNPCPPVCGEHGWHYSDAPGPGRGAFRGCLVRTGEL